MAKLYKDRPYTTPVAIHAGTQKELSFEIGDFTLSGSNTVQIRVRERGKDAYHLVENATIDTANNKVEYTLSDLETGVPGRYEVRFHLLDSSSNLLARYPSGGIGLEITGLTSEEAETRLAAAVEAAVTAEEAKDQVLSSITLANMGLAVNFYENAVDLPADAADGTRALVWEGTGYQPYESTSGVWSAVGGLIGFDYPDHVITSVNDFITAPVTSVFVYLDSGMQSGKFRYNSSLTSADGGVTFQASDGKVWERIFSGPVQAEWYGVSASSADNSAALQLAISYTQAVEGILELPAGELTINSPITVEYELPFIIQGKGAFSSVICPRNFDVSGGMTAAILLDGSESSGDNPWVELRDFGIVGENNTLVIGIYSQYSTPIIQFSRVRVRNCWDGIRLADSWITTLIDCDCVWNLNDGLSVGLDLSGADSTVNAIRVYGGRYVRNTINGIFLNVHQNNLISGADVEGNSGNGIYSRFAQGLTIDTCYHEQVDDDIPTSWALSTAYSRGDRVYTTNELCYVCISGHTSSSNDEPGTGVNEATYWLPSASFYMVSCRNVVFNGCNSGWWQDYHVHFWITSSDGVTLNSCGVSRGTGPEDPKLGTFVYASSATVSLNGVYPRGIKYGVRDLSGAVHLTFAAPKFVGVDYPISLNNTTSSVSMLNVDEDAYYASDFGGGVSTIASVADNGGVIRCTETSHGLEDGQNVYCRFTTNAAGHYVVTVIDADTYDLDGSVYVGAETDTPRTSSDDGTLVKRFVTTQQGDFITVNFSTSSSDALVIRNSTSGDESVGGQLLFQNTHATRHAAGIPRIQAVQVGADDDLIGFDIFVRDSSIFADDAVRAVRIKPDGTVVAYLGLDVTGTIALNGGSAGQGSAIADATDATDVITQLNSLLAYLRSRGDIAT